MNKRHFLKLLVASPLLLFFKPEPRKWENPVLIAAAEWASGNMTNEEFTTIAAEHGLDVGIVDGGSDCYCQDCKAFREAVSRQIEKINAMAKEGA